MVLWLELPGGSRLLPGFVRREALTCPPPSLGCAPPGSGRSSLACVMRSGPALRPGSQALLSGPGAQAHALRPCSHRWSCMDGAARACTIPYALAHAPHLPNAPFLPHPPLPHPPLPHPPLLHPPLPPSYQPPPIPWPASTPSLCLACFNAGPAAMLHAMLGLVQSTSPLTPKHPTQEAPPQEAQGRDRVRLCGPRVAHEV